MTPLHLFLLIFFPVVLSFSSLSALEIPTKKEGRLLWNNNDYLPASLVGWDTSTRHLLINSSTLEGTHSLNTQLIDSLFIADYQKTPRTQAQVHMTNGDKIKGNIIGITSKHLKIKTLWAGDILIQRSMIDALFFTPTETALYTPQDSLTFWKSTDKEEKWKIRNNIFFSPNASVALSAKCNLPDKIHIKLTLLNKSVPKLKITLWADNPTSNLHKNAYNIFLFNSHIRMDKKIDGGTETFLHKSIQESKVILPKTYIDLFADRTKETFTLYINGIERATWNGAAQQDDPDLTRKTPPTMGDVIQLTNIDKDNTLQMSDLYITPWNGAKLGSELIAIPQADRKKTLLYDPPNTTITPRHHTLRPKLTPDLELIQLVNGDLFQAKILSLDEKSLSIEYRDKKIIVPLDRILALNFIPKKPLYQRLSNTDIRLNMTDQSEITLQPKSSENTRLHAYSEALGEIPIDIPHIQRIKFNIHTP